MVVYTSDSVVGLSRMRIVVVVDGGIKEMTKHQGIESCLLPTPFPTLRTTSAFTSAAPPVPVISTSCSSISCSIPTLAAAYAASVRTVPPAAVSTMRRICDVFELCRVRCCVCVGMHKERTQSECVLCAAF